MDLLMRMNQIFAQKANYESYSRNTAQGKRECIREDTQEFEL